MLASPRRSAVVTPLLFFFYCSSPTRVGAHGYCMCTLYSLLGAVFALHNGRPGKIALCSLGHEITGRHHNLSRSVLTEQTQPLDAKKARYKGGGHEYRERTTMPKHGGANANPPPSPQKPTLANAWLRSCFRAKCLISHMLKSCRGPDQGLFGSKSCRGWDRGAWQ